MIEVLELNAVGAVSCAFLRNSHRWLEKVFAERRFYVCVCVCVCLSFSLELFVACKNTHTCIHASALTLSPIFGSRQFCYLPSGSVIYHIPYHWVQTIPFILWPLLSSSSPLRELVFFFLRKGGLNRVTVSCFWEWGSQLWQVCVCVCECAMGVQCLFSSVGGSPVDFSWSRATIRANKPVTVFLPLCSSSSSSSVWSRDKKKVGRCYHTKFQLKTVPVDCPVLFLWMVSQSLQLWICVYPVSTSASV